MKECPECGLVHADVVSTCDCGYKFPVHPRKQCPVCHRSVDESVLTCDCGYEFDLLRTSSLGDMFFEARNLLFRILNVAVLLLSAFWCFYFISIITNQYDYEQIAIVVLWLLIFGVNLYTLKITSGWGQYRYELTRYEKTIAALSIVSGLAVIAITCFVWWLVSALSRFE